MTRKNNKTLKITDVKSFDYFKFLICKRLKMNNWQFEKLSFRLKIYKWLENNKDKKLIFEIHQESILKSIYEEKQRAEINKYGDKIPENYDTKNPLNRWIHQEFISLSDEQKIEIENISKLEAQMGLNDIISSLSNLDNVNINKI